MGFANFLVLWFLASFAAGGMASTTINVVDRGAIGDGKTDDVKAFSAAWSAACADASSPTIQVPSGKTFLVSPVIFEGPCKSPIHVQVDGNIVAPKRLWKISYMEDWITFKSLKGITVDGTGQIDGNGKVWWNCRSNNKCSNAPDTLAFESCSNVKLSGLKFINSPKKHVSIYKTVQVYVGGLTITAPEDSPNTDGVHIGQSQHVQVLDSTIGTGDDCVSIGSGTYDLNVSHITCGPGHGISVGSLGEDGSQATAEQIHVSFCNFTKTTNGVRIKTWQGGSGYAKGITFESVNFNSVKNPIIIDQFYCENYDNCPNKTSAVQVSDVHYIGAIGSTASNMAISLNCSQAVACTGIIMEGVNIHSSEGGEAGAVCNNVDGSQKDPVIPSVPCLKKT